MKTTAARRAAHRRRTRLYPLLASALLAGWTIASAGGDTAAADRDVDAHRPAGTEITLAFGGDVHVEGAVAERLARAPGSLLGDAATPLRSADLAVVNLETAVTDRGEPQPKKYTFRAPASALPALADVGVDVVSVANNHALDYGHTGLADTFAAAGAAGLAVVGGGADEHSAFAPYSTTVRGQRVTVLAATQVLDASLAASWSAGEGHAGVASADDPRRLLAAVRSARESGGLVVVYLHWGREKDPCPPAEAQDLARSLVAAGADVIVGSHAHVRLPDDYVDGAYVHYGLGNLLWYKDTEDSRGGVLTLTIRGRAVSGKSWLPTRMAGATPIKAPSSPPAKCDPTADVADADFG